MDHSHIHGTTDPAPYTLSSVPCMHAPFEKSSVRTYWILTYFVGGSSPNGITLSFSFDVIIRETSTLFIKTRKKKVKGIEFTVAWDGSRESVVRHLDQNLQHIYIILFRSVSHIAFYIYFDFLFLVWANLKFLNSGCSYVVSFLKNFYWW